MVDEISSVWLTVKKRHKFLVNKIVPHGHHRKEDVKGTNQNIEQSILKKWKILINDLSKTLLKMQVANS